MNDDCSAEGGTIMKKYIFFIFFIFYSSQFAYSAQPYLEGQIGTAIVEDVSGTLIVRGSGFNQAIGIENSYDDALTLGGEFGFKNIIPNSNIRMALGITAFEIELETATASIAGTTFNGTAISGSVTFTRDQLATVGVSFDNDVRIFGLNTYLDLSKDTTFVPYIGLGLGLADIENAEDMEFAASFMFGGNYMITDNAYIGAKGGYHNIFGPTDKLGIEYDDVNAWTFNIALGIEF